MRKLLALIVDNEAKVLFSSQNAKAALHKIDLSTGTAKQGAREPATFDGATLTSLDSGLYVASSEDKLTCKLCSGEVTIVVLGGEDPWPVPPAKILAGIPTYSLFQLLERWP